MKCKICNSEKLDRLKLEENYYHCRNCNLIFIDEDEIIEPEEEKIRYEQHDNTHENEGYVKMFEGFIKELIEPYTDEIETVLEFGCGPGPVLADLLEEKGFIVDIYDPCFFPKKVFEEKQYDLITSTEVFEHFKDPQKEINALVKHLKKGGYLAIITSFHTGVNNFPDWWYKWDPTHITFYNPDTLKEIAKINSLEILYADGNKYCLFQKV